MSKHTAGPWKHDETWGLIKYGKTEIAALHSGNKANANLIAAAPELLEACHKSLRMLDPSNVKENMIWDILYKVINKAEGTN